MLDKPDHCRADGRQNSVPPASHNGRVERDHPGLRSPIHFNTTERPPTTSKKKSKRTHPSNLSSLRPNTHR